MRRGSKWPCRGEKCWHATSPIVQEAQKDNEKGHGMKTPIKVLKPEEYKKKENLANNPDYNFTFGQLKAWAETLGQPDLDSDELLVQLEALETPKAEAVADSMANWTYQGEERGITLFSELQVMQETVRVQLIKDCTATVFRDAPEDERPLMALEFHCSTTPDKMEEMKKHIASTRGFSR